jgi:hypothetical protein
MSRLKMCMPRGVLKFMCGVLTQRGCVLKKARGVLKKPCGVLKLMRGAPNTQVRVLNKIVVSHTQIVSSLV